MKITTIYDNTCIELQLEAIGAQTSEDNNHSLDATTTTSTASSTRIKHVQCTHDTPPALNLIKLINVGYNFMSSHHTFEIECLGYV